MPAQLKDWSKYQQAIFEDVAKGTGHTVVIARAGSGKTSTLVEAFRYLPKKLKTLMVAFNKSIAEELNERAPSYVDTMTLHSLGFRAVRAAFGKEVALDPDKTLNIIQNILQEKGIRKQEKEAWPTALSLLRATNLCKGYLIDTPSKIDLMMDKFDIDTCELERDDYIKTICLILRKCKEIKMCIDFTDMIWYPFVYNMPVGKWDRVFIDETQDLNEAQIHMALSACKKDGRICAVGDDRQSIYSFAGADSDSIDNIIKKLNAKTLPLSITYRCAKDIVKLAQEMVPDIEAHPNAKQGTIHDVSEKDFLVKAKPGDFILSRINAPNIYYCLALLRMGVPANIQGKDVGASLAYMIKKSEKKTVEDFLGWLDMWKKTETERLRKKNRDPIIIIDKAACLETLCEGAKSLDSVLDNIKDLFHDGDDSTRVILSTTHKAKGLERDRVFVLTWTYRRGMNREEENLFYVAITRARNELFLVKK
jgi:DNA helicase-2/ATP-dependent DNA helicase PcrA